MRQGFGSIWILVPGEGLHRFDPTTLQEVASVPIDGRGFFIADGAIWVLGQSTQGDKGAPAAAAPLYRINPESFETTGKLAWGDDLYPFTAAEGSLWGVRGKAGKLVRIDPTTGQSLAEIRVGPPHGHRRINLSTDNYTGIAAGEGALWVIEDRAEGNLIKVDPKTNQAVATIPLGTSPGGVVVGGGFVGSRRVAS
jgi:streptogramin lyase